ncbi:MAG: exosortase E/protease, VPEID-CTERM system [Proteobacteria bacterium]|nr:exosortase E/protease, VPEID-CTERM system [Pseudomonadota bacterium]
MSNHDISLPPIPSWPPHLTLRFCLLVLVLTAELLGLSVNFDNEVFATDPSWWTRLAFKLPVFLRIGLAFAAVFLLMLSPRIGGIVGEARHRASEHPWLRWLLSHLCVFGVFYLATATVFASAANSGQVSGSLMGLWVCLGIANLLSWLLAVAPSGFWLGLASRERWPLVYAALAGTLAWLGGLLAEELWQPLAVGTFWLSRQMLALVYPEVSFDPTHYILGTSKFSVEIAPQCSGYEGMALVMVFLSLYLWLFRTEIRFPQAFWLFPVGILAIWLANAVRITALIILGSSFSTEIALGGFHSQAGWIGFIAISLGLIVASRRLRLFSKRQPSAVEHRGGSTAEALLVPGLVLMATIMLSSALSSGFDRLYPLRVLTMAAALWSYRSVYRQWDWSVSWPAPIIGIAVFVLWMLLEPPAGLGATALEASLATLSDTEKSVWLASRVIGSVFLVPVVEEMAFRGYMIRRLAGQELEGSTPPRFTVWSFCLSSLAFGLLHGRWLAGTLAGMALAGALYRRGKLADAIVAHLVANSLIALSVLAFGKWALWSA